MPQMPPSRRTVSRRDSRKINLSLGTARRTPANGTAPSRNPRPRSCPPSRMIAGRIRSVRRQNSPPILPRLFLPNGGGCNLRTHRLPKLTAPWLLCRRRIQSRKMLSHLVGAIRKPCAGWSGRRRRWSRPVTIFPPSAACPFSRSRTVRRADPAAVSILSRRFCRSTDRPLCPPVVLAWRKRRW